MDFFHSFLRSKAGYSGKFMVFFAQLVTQTRRKLMKNTKSLLVLMVMAIALAGCCRRKDRCKTDCDVKTRKNRSSNVVDMPVNKHAKNKVKTQLFDENVDAFILDEDSVSVADNDQGGISWQDAQERTEIAQTIHFDYDKANLTAKEKEQLAAQVEKIKELTQEGKTVVLKGHSCMAGKATAAYNLALSNDRAHKAADVLAKAGVPKDKMKVFGVGYEEPTVMEETITREGQAPNRRVEIYTINA